jgi:hypothetical protein
MYYERFLDRLTYEQIDKLIEKGQQFTWLRLLVIGTMYVIKFLLVSFALYLGYFLSNIKTKVPFGSIFKIVILAETVFFLPAIIRIIWFLVIETKYSLDDVQYFYPLSLLNIIDYKTIDLWWIYPLQTLNLFEAAYWVVLAIGIAKIIPEISTEKAFVIVTTSYGTGLVLWITAVMFMWVSFV